MRMKKRDCIIIVSGIIRQRKDVIRSRIRLDWQVVIQLCMDMFMIHCVSLIHLVWQFCLKLVLTGDEIAVFMLGMVYRLMN